MREESGQQQHRINPNSHGGQKEHKTERNEGMGRKRKNEMMGREGGWDGREHSLRRGRESECQGKAVQMGTRGDRWGKCPHHAFRDRSLRCHAEGGKFA